MEGETGGASGRPLTQVPSRGRDVRWVFHHHGWRAIGAESGPDYFIKVCRLSDLPFCNSFLLFFFLRSIL